MIATAKSTKLGHVLLKQGLLTEARLQEALQQQASSQRFLGTLLLERGWVTPEQLLKALSEQYRMPYKRLADDSIERAAVEAMPLKIALHYRVMPVRLDRTTLTVAIADPQEVQLADDVRAALQERYTIEPVLSTEEDIANAIKKYELYR